MAFWEEFCPLCFCGEVGIHPATETQGTEHRHCLQPSASSHKSGLFDDFTVVLSARENPAALEGLEISVLKVRSALSSARITPQGSSDAASSQK